MASDMTPEVSVDSIQLMNRSFPSGRCLSKTAQFVSTLAPLCLPKPIEFWQQEVGGKAVWADLQSRRARTSLIAFQDDSLPEVICYHVLSLSQKESVVAQRKLGHSKYDLNLALMAAAAALGLSVLIRRIRTNFDSARWQDFFETVEQAQKWKDEEITVHIIAIYKAMDPVCSEEAKFLQSLRGARTGTAEIVEASSVHSREGRIWESTVAVFSS